MQSSAPSDSKPSRRWHALALAAALSTTPGCDSEPMSADTAEDSETSSTGEVEPFDHANCHAGAVEASLEIGDGAGGFSPATEVDLVYGPQGGYHIVVGLKLEGFEATSPLEARLEGRIDGVRLGSGSLSIGLQCDETEQALLASGLLLVWDATPEQVGNRDVEVFVRVTNGDGDAIENVTMLYVNDPNGASTE